MASRWRHGRGKYVHCWNRCTRKDHRSRKEDMPYTYFWETLYFQPDVFDGVVTGSIWDGPILPRKGQFTITH